MKKTDIEILSTYKSIMNTGIFLVGDHRSDSGFNGDPRVQLMDDPALIGGSGAGD